MSLTICMHLAITINMNVFATGIAGNLRVVLSILSVVERSTIKESFFIGFFDESDLGKGAYANHVQVPAALARSVVQIGSPANDQEHEETIDAVVLDPEILGHIRAMASAHPLLSNLTGPIDALASKADFENSTPHATTLSIRGNKETQGGPL